MTAEKAEWSVEKLKKWAKPALKYPRLVDIARTATSNTEAKNLALEFTKEQGLEEGVAMACRWLRILRAKLSEEEFEGYVASQNGVRQEGKEMGEKKNLIDIKFDLPKAEITLDEDSKKIRFTDGAWGAIDFCEQLVHDLGEFLDKEYAEEHLMTVNRETLLRTMIEVLEKNCGLEPFIEALEKKGLKVKICVNCKEFVDPIGTGDMGKCEFNMELRQGGTYADLCEHWAPKEVSADEIAKHDCPNPECGVRLTEVRPGIYRCPYCHQSYRKEVKGLVPIDDYR